MTHREKCIIKVMRGNVDGNQLWGQESVQLTIQPVAKTKALEAAALKVAVTRSVSIFPTAFWMFLKLPAVDSTALRLERAAPCNWSRDGSEGREGGDVKSGTSFGNCSRDGSEGGEGRDGNDVKSGKVIGRGKRVSWMKRCRKAPAAEGRPLRRPTAEGRNYPIRRKNLPKFRYFPSLLVTEMNQNNAY